MQAAVAPPSGIQRGRGGFYRSANDTPWVTDPNGAIVGSGPRKGLPLRIAYGSPSSRGREIENDVGLTKFKQRLTLLGIGMEQALAPACSHLADLPIGSPEFNTAADTIVVAADRITRSSLAADRGTHGHLLCERADTTEVWADIIPDGEHVGLDTSTQDAVVAAWRDLLAANGLSVLAIEASCVDDLWHLAGTLDRIVRTTRELRFRYATGEIVTIPAGTVLVLDIKFGKTRKAHPIQIASYAQSVPYDTEAETRGVWPWPIDQDHALIAHGDFGGDGVPPSISLVHVDLRAGREHGGACVVQAKAWAARDDVWSIAQVEVEGQEPTSTTSPLLAATAAGEGAATVPQTLSPASSRLALVDARATLAETPTQGADLATGFDELWSQMFDEFTALDNDARAWRGELVGDAQRARVPFHVQQVRTERTYHINKGIIALAAGEGDHDEILRALLALVLGEVAYFPGIRTGHLVGSLTATQAATFASLVDAYFADGLTSSVDHDGHLVFAA